MILYGLSGTNGSGKDSLGAFLAREYNFLFVSSSDLLRAEAEKRDLPTEREVLRAISADWRREGGLGVLIDKAIDLYRKEGGDVAYAGLITGSLRNPGEADRVHELGGKMIWVDADPMVRYKRITSGARERQDDNKTYEQFLEEQEAEMKHSGDAATLSMADVKARSDIFIQNNGNDMTEFESAVKAALHL